MVQNLVSLLGDLDLTLMEGTPCTGPSLYLYRHTLVSRYFVLFIFPPSLNPSLPTTHPLVDSGEVSLADLTG